MPERRRRNMTMNCDVRACVTSAAIVITVAIVAHARPLLAQTPNAAAKPIARIIGVFDARTGDPLPGVQVRDAFTGTFAMTTATGTAPLNFLSFRGTAAVVELRKLGYQASQILVSRSDTSSITELLDPIHTLAPVITTEKYRVDRDLGLWSGFEQRCQSRSMTCVRTDELEKRPAANLADFIVHAAGVTIGACEGGGARGKDSRSTQCGKISMHSLVIPPAYCEPTFFVDGFEWNPRGGPATDMKPNTPAEAPYTPSNVKAVEVYPPEMPRPSRFEGNPICGAVVIWTK
jgi:hypothetical protein